MTKVNSQKIKPFNAADEDEQNEVKKADIVH